MVGEAMKAVSSLRTNVPRPLVINARFIKPIDERMLRQILQKFDAVLTIEEGILSGGFGSSVLGWLTEHGYGGRVYHLGIADEFVDHGSRKTLLERLGLSASKISEAIIQIHSGNEVRSV